MRIEPRPYYSSGGGYCNVALIGDGLLVDVEGDDSDNKGSLTYRSLEFVSGVSIYAGPLRGLDSSRGASLVVVTRKVGEEGIGLHWIAKTEEEEEHLLQFAQTLLKAISKKGS